MFDGTYQTMAQVFIAVSIIPIWFMLRNGRGKSEPQSALWRMLLFGGLSIALTLAVAIPLDWLFPQISAIIDGKVGLNPPENLLLATFLFASIEEIMKFVPAAFYLYKKPYFNWRSDGVLYFGLIGLTFGFIEDMLYVSSGGVAVGIIRIVFGLFFHGAVTAIVGYSLSHKKVTGGSWFIVLLGLLLSISLHSLYNYGLFVSAWQPLFVLVSIAVSISVNANFFIMFWLANRKDKLQFVPVVESVPAVVPTPTTSQPAVIANPPLRQIVQTRSALPLSITSLIMGVVSLITWVLPFFGLVPPIAAMIIGLTMIGKDEVGKNYNIVGSILGGFGLLLSILIHVFLVLVIVLGS